MKNTVKPYNWRSELGEMRQIASIDNDFILLESAFISTSFKYPFKTDAIAAIIVLKGTTKGKINLKPYTTTAPGFIILLPDQILEYEYISEDFSGLFIVMSKKFSSNLNFEGSFPLFLSIRNNPFISMTNDEIEVLAAYYDILKRAVQKVDNPNRIEVVKYLIKAFFYSTSYEYHKLEERKRTKNEVLVENFLNHAQAHYKEHRGVEFYADKLCLTPKYLSKVIKENSGMSANEWVDSYVILEAKALLKSTNKTIQQISEELNFPSQSFFGKYFKRHVGVSPKDYKKN
jgi:AraC family transcriptional regulator, transcriptional activator of pobA